MNIQIFGTAKSRDTQKAQRFFKERRIPFQYVDLKTKEMSRGELLSVIKAVGSIDGVVDENAKDRDALALFRYTIEENRLDFLLCNQQLLLLPVVRDGRNATVGYEPDVWKSWEQGA